MEKRIKDTGRRVMNLDVLRQNLIVKTHSRTLRAICDTQTQSYEEVVNLSRKKKIDTQIL